MTAGSSSAQTKVTVRLDFFHSETHAGWFAALERGFWEKEGLDVEIRPGQGSVTTVQQVAAGNDTFGYANAVAMTQQVSRGADVIAVASPRQAFDGGIAYWPDRGISTPKDLEGKTCAITAGGFISLLYPVWAQRVNIDPAKVNSRVLDAAAGSALFGARSVDCVESTIVQANFFYPAVNGVKPKIFRYTAAPAEMNALGFTIIVNSRQAQGNPGLVTKFVRGAIKGWAWACDNPRAATEAARTHFTSARDFDTSLGIWKSTCKLRRTKNTLGQPFGVMSLKDWQTTVQLLRTSPQLGLSANVPPPKTLFTNQYVNNIYPKCKAGQKSTNAKPCVS
jgi:NitT/TauT family transport system substrate-binding protein